MANVYFNNLNGLRFIAASMVLVSHIEQIKNIKGVSTLYETPFFSILGTLGVALFFVLSGFLITYLLMIEKENPKKNSISIKNFYMRRVLRIWPLYFIVIGLGLFLMPALGFFEFTPIELNVNYDLAILIPLFVFFLPNVILVIFGGIPFLHQTWSIGTEEQFYLIWPWIIKYSVNYLKVFIIIMFGYLAIKLGLYSFKNTHIIRKIYDIWATLSIVSLSIGGVCAYLYHNYKDQIIKFISSKVKQISILILFFLFSFFCFKCPSVIRFDIFSIFFGYLILNLTLNNSFNFLEIKLFNYLGKISFGIYMWHPIAITLSFFILGSYSSNNFLLYTTSFLFTIFIAAISYEFFEKRFLVLKKKYS